MGAHESVFDCLDIDVIMMIVMCLEDPADLIRLSSLSRFWYNFVVANGLCRKLCLRMFPQLSAVDSVVERSSRRRNPIYVRSSNPTEWEKLESEHRAFAFLAQQCKSLPATNCIAEAVYASSIDNYPIESIVNTLDRGDRVGGRASYWSSKGQSDDTVPEMLVYKLDADFCFVNEINIQPFQAYFEAGEPIYAAKSVRFRVGHLKPCIREDNMHSEAIQRIIWTGNAGEFPIGPAVNHPNWVDLDDKFIWTYTSQEFPMAQENSLQKFKLPKPILCIGGFVLIELLGRVQKEELDGLFYICVSHVEVMGGTFFPGFDIEIIEPSGKILLKCFPDLHSVCAGGKRPLVISRVPGFSGAFRELPRVAYGNVAHIFQFLGPEDEAEDPPVE